MKPIALQSFSGTTNRSFSYNRVTTHQWEGVYSSTYSTYFGKSIGVVYVGYIEAYDNYYAIFKIVLYRVRLYMYASDFQTRVLLAVWNIEVQSFMRGCF